MEKIIIVSDFDGTITKKDTLYSFFEKYCVPEWQEVEQLWVDKKISSKECLIKEFELVKNLSKKLIDDFILSVEIDEYFKEAHNFFAQNSIDFIVVSDGIDYFIKNVFKKFNIENINIITNHGEFINNEFKITFPNDYKKCKNNSGTCKCYALKKLKEKYDRVIYIGDGTSDFCVAPRADYLFAKKSLAEFCKKNDIKYFEYENYFDVVKKIKEIIFL